MNIKTYYYHLIKNREKIVEQISVPSERSSNKMKGLLRGGDGFLLLYKRIDSGTNKSKDIAIFKNRSS